jgi:hypothetical protein
MRTPLTVIGLLLALLAYQAVATDPTPAQDPAAAPLERQFRDTVRPVLQAHCAECHGGEKPKAGLDLTAYPTADAVARDFRRWEAVQEHLKAGSMPPESRRPRPAGRSSTGSGPSAGTRRNEPRATPARSPPAG